MLKTKNRLKLLNIIFIATNKKILSFKNAIAVKDLIKNSRYYDNYEGIVLDCWYSHQDVNLGETTPTT